VVGRAGSALFSLYCNCSAVNSEIIVDFIAAVLTAEAECLNPK